MDIELDFGKEKITIGSEEMYWLKCYADNYATFLKIYSEILFNLRKYFVVNDFNYADLLGYMIYENDYYFPKAPGLVTIFNYIEILDSLKQLKEMKLKINDFYHNTFRKCAEIVGKRKNIKVKVVSEQYLKRRFAFVYDRPFFVRNLLKIRVFLRYVFGRKRKLLGKCYSPKADVLILSNILVYNKEPEKNILFGPLIKQLNKNRVSNKILTYEPLYQTEKMKRFVKEFMLHKHNYLGDYYSLKHFCRCQKDFRALKNKWEAVKDSDEFKGAFTYKGYNIYDAIRPRLELIFNALSYMACDNKAITESIIKKDNFKVLCLDHEENMYGKGFMLNLRKQIVKKVAALSHEIISDDAIHIHFKNKEVLNRESAVWRPLPDRKLVWGEYAKKILIEKCNYPEVIIGVTGNPKFDSIFNSKYDGKEILEKINLSNLDSSKKKILLLTEAEKALLKELMSAYTTLAKQNPELEFIIKPHPGEDMNNLYNELRKHGQQPKNLHVVNKYQNIYELVFVSDYIVAKMSTVCFEAMLMGKIVFILNPRKERLINLPYVQSGAAIEIHSTNDLRKELVKLEDKKYEQGVRKSMREFVNYIHFKNDGKASERVTNEIIMLLK